MKKSLLKTTFLFAATLLLFAACKKDKDVAITKESISGSYKYNKVTFTLDAGGGEQTITNDWLDDCQLDDVIKFMANGEYEYEDQGVSCGWNPSDGQWEFVSSKEIVVDGDSYELVSFNGSILVIGRDYDDNGAEGTLKMYLKKQ